MVRRLRWARQSACWCTIAAFVAMGWPGQVSAQASGSDPGAASAPGEADEQEPRSPSPSSEGEPQAATERAGLWGLGLGLEFPYVGVPAAFGSRGNSGLGYTFGGAVSWAWTANFELRAAFRWTIVRGARPVLTLLGREERERERQRAQWFGLDGTLGGTYFFGLGRNAWAPFVGLDGGVGANGYRYFLGEDSLATDGQLSTSAPVPTVANALGFVASARLGVRLELAEWLSSIMQLQGGYARLGERQVSGTVEAREARNVAENIWTVMATFAVRVGL